MPIATELNWWKKMLVHVGLILVGAVSYYVAERQVAIDTKADQFQAYIDCIIKASTFDWEGHGISGPHPSASEVCGSP